MTNLATQSTATTPAKARAIVTKGQSKPSVKSGKATKPAKAKPVSSADQALDKLKAANLGAIKLTRSSTFDKAMTAALGRLKKSAEDTIRRYVAVGDVIKSAKALVDDQTGDPGAFKALWSLGDGKPWGIGYSTATRYIRAADLGADEMLSRFAAQDGDSLNIKALMGEATKPKALKGPKQPEPAKPAEPQPSPVISPDVDQEAGLGPEMVNARALLARATNDELLALATVMRDELELRNLRDAMQDTFCGKSVN